MNAVPLLRVDAVAKSFEKPDGQELLVLEGVNLQLFEGQIIGLLGRSGSGKSTLLRLIAGLATPTRGQCNYLGVPVDGPAVGISMVFQSFALFPWLTVYENVALGLEAQRLARAEIRRRTLAAIDLIGLDGFESAYPRELSGGMRQRVGFARALVVHPNILLMCDRVLVFGSNPGRVLSAIEVTLPQPRNRLDPAFRELVERIYVEMTARMSGVRAGVRTEFFPGQGIGSVLPHISSNELSGLLEAVAAEPFRGKADLPKIATDLQMEIDELFPVAETLQMLRFAELEGGDLTLTEAGVAFANAALDERKRIFARQLLTYVPLAAHVRRVLDERASHVARKSRFIDELEDFMTEDDAEQTLRAIIGWGRYAEVFAYEDESARFTLENPA